MVNVAATSALAFAYFIALLFSYLRVTLKEVQLNHPSMKIAYGVFFSIFTKTKLQCVLLIVFRSHSSTMTARERDVHDVDFPIGSV